MNTVDFDQGRRPFWGDEHFPYGIARSGQFSCQQAALLERHGYAYQGLTSGLRDPQTPNEESFVAFFRGEHVPEGPHEKAWKRYCSVVDDLVRRAAVYTPVSKSAVPEDWKGVDY